MLQSVLADGSLVVARDDEVPRFMATEPKNMKKCTFCFDRQADGKAPACVTACLSETLVYGKREDIIKEGQARLAKMKETYPNAELVDQNDVSWIYLLPYPEAKYGMFRDPSKAKQKVALG